MPRSDKAPAVLVLVLHDRAARAARLAGLTRAGYHVRVVTRAAEMVKALADGQVALVVHGMEASEVALARSVALPPVLPRLALSATASDAECLARVSAALGAPHAAPLDETTPRRP